MKDSKEYRSGVITVDNHNYVFHANGYRFTFMDSDADSRNDNTIPASEDGFIYGRLHDGHDIGIYVGQTKDFSIYRSRPLITGAYCVFNNFIEDADTTGIWGIEFCGGTLNTLLDRSSNSWNFTEDGKITIDNLDISHTYQINHDDEQWLMVIGAHSKCSSGIKGISITDSGVYLRIVFPSKKTVGDFLRVHAVIKEMLSFMAFRKNVGFDEIYFLRAKDEYSFNQHCAQAYIRNDEPFTSKSWYKSISFDDLGEHVSSLMELMLQHTDNESSYMLGFLPQNDNDVMRMSPMRLREVCSALECELNFVKDLKGDEEQNLCDLIKQIKKIIKDHRKGPSRLSDKTYDVIHGSMDHWSLATADRIYLLYQRYEDIIINMVDCHLTIGADEINKFVKFRNNVTHGRHRIVDEVVGVTAIVLQGLVYCCMLTRIGMDRQQLKMICSERRLLY